MSEIACLVLGIFLTITWIEFTITPESIEKYQQVCQKNDGLEKITRDIMRSVATCKDGARFKIDKE